MTKETLKWKVIVDLTIENDDDESITDGTLYMDEEFGYYQRTLWVCGFYRISVKISTRNTLMTK